RSGAASPPPRRLYNRPVSAPGIFRPPAAENEPIRTYAPGSPERAELQRRLAEIAGERISIPLVIGGQRVETEATFEAVMPHDRDHVLADVAKGDASHMEGAINAAREAHHAWPSTLNAATMLNQSKTAHQAEIDSACETIDFLRFNADYLVRIYEEQPRS